MLAVQPRLLRMALPKSKLRTITIDGSSFGWAVSGGAEKLQVRVERKENPASQLVASFGAAARGAGRAITPGVIEALIRLALERGWKPDARKPAQFTVEDFPRVRRQQRPRTRLCRPLRRVSLLCRCRGGNPAMSEAGLPNKLAQDLKRSKCSSTRPERSNAL